MRRTAIIATLTLTLALPAAAQSINLDFPGLADRAEEVVDVTLDASMLRMAAKFLSTQDAEERSTREIIQGLKGVYVRSYEFDKDNQYDRSLAAKVRAQLGANWKPLVTVRSRTKENVNILARMVGDKIDGLVIISAEPREFTVVNIEGPVDIDKLSSLEGAFGIPKFSKEKDDE